MSATRIINFYLDIETKGRDDAAEYLDVIEAPANYKDPLKIAEYLITKRKEALEKAALGELTNEIFFINLTNFDTGQTFLLEGKEKEILDALALRLPLTQNHRFITFGGRGFDLPTIYRRSVLCDSNMANFFFPESSTTRPSFDCLDIMRDFMAGGYVSANQVFKIFGLPQKEELTNHYATYTSDRERFITYSKREATNIKIIASKMYPYLGISPDNIE